MQSSIAITADWAIELVTTPFLVVRAILRARNGLGRERRGGTGVVEGRQGVLMG